MFQKLARYLAQPHVVDWLLCRTFRTPYSHIKSADGATVYMWRYWLFNPYKAGTSGKGAWFPLSIRLHHICLPDVGRDLHDHPWNARTFILKGWYVEHREDGRAHLRPAGTTTTLRHGEFHRITEVSPGGCVTLFVTFRYKGPWGFKVNGFKIPHTVYRP